MKRLYELKNQMMTLHTERDVIVSFARSVTRSDSKVLDVGCGFGRNLKVLANSGINAQGVEVNPVAVASVRAAGMKCLTHDEFRNSIEQYDLIVMSHIIEHFGPKDLLDFMNEYLLRLKAGGHLLIATPLFSKNFFDDFDHVKPYQPEGIAQVFGGGREQIQYSSPHRLQLVRLAFTKVPFRLKFFESNYVRTGFPLVALINIALTALFRASGGLIGTKLTWVGLYRKA